MKIYRAVKPNKITQRFGIEGTLPILLPKYQAICRKPGDCLKGHTGFDFAAPLGTKIYWDCDIKGKVSKTMIDNKLGWGVYVITEDNFQHRFWHLSCIACQVGQVLESGNLIGLVGNTGWATGYHLHRDLKPVIKDKNGNYIQKFPNNGYFGAIDLAPYFENIFVLDYIAQLKRRISMLKRLIEKIRELLALKSS